MSARIKKTNINLLINLSGSKPFSEQLLSWAITYGRYIIIITQIIVLSVFFARFKLDRDYSDLKDSLTQRQVLVESMSDVENEIRRVQKKLSNISTITQNQDYPVKILQFFQNNSPTDINFLSLNIEKGRVDFSATVETLRSFNFLLSQLQKDNLFTDIQLADIQRRKDGKIEFKIYSTINISKFVQKNPV